jgi:hypothetical protein
MKQKVRFSSRSGDRWTFAIEFEGVGEAPKSWNEWWGSIWLWVEGQVVGWPSEIEMVMTGFDSLVESAQQIPTGPSEGSPTNPPGARSSSPYRAHITRSRAPRAGTDGCKGPDRRSASSFGNKVPKLERYSGPLELFGALFNKRSMNSRSFPLCCTRSSQVSPKNGVCGKDAPKKPVTGTLLKSRLCRQLEELCYASA